MIAVVAASVVEREWERAETFIAGRDHAEVTFETGQYPDEILRAVAAECNRHYACTLELRSEREKAAAERHAEMVERREKECEAYDEKRRKWDAKVEAWHKENDRWYGTTPIPDSLWREKPSSRSCMGLPPPGLLYFKDTLTIRRTEKEL